MVPHDQHHPVPGVLELPQLAQHNRMSEVDVRRSRVDPELDPQRPALRAGDLELRGERALGQAVDGAQLEDSGFLGSHLRCVSHRTPMLDSRPLWSPPHCPPAAGRV